MYRPGSPFVGQPRPVVPTQRPTAAERVRTLLASNVSAVLTIPGSERRQPEPGDGLEVQSVSASGEAFMLVRADSWPARATRAAQGTELAAVMEITDIAPVAVPHRVRGRAWIAGWLTQHAEDVGGPALRPDRRLLRLESAEAHIEDLWGAEQVEPEELGAAVPDPVARHEAELLQHLATSHPGQLRGLCGLLSERPPASQDWTEVVPLSLDRFALRVRLRTGENSFDVRFDFPAPVASVAGLQGALSQLFEAAKAASSET